MTLFGMNHSNAKSPTKASLSFFFNVFDYEHLVRDELLGESAVAVTGLLKDQPTNFELPVFHRKKEVGKLTVTVTSHGISWVEIASQLRAEVEKMAHENDRYKALNVELEGNIQNLHKEIGVLSGEVDRFTVQNDKLEGEVNKLHDENVKLEETSKALQGQVEALHGEVQKFTEQNNRLEHEVNTLHSENEALQKTRQALEENVNRLHGEVNQFHLENEKLEHTRKELEGEVGRLKENVDRFHHENDKLEATRKGLEGEVGVLKGEVGILKGENEKLAKTSEELGENVASLGNKIQILDEQIVGLQNTRKMLDEQLVRQESQNKQLAVEVSNLNSIKEGLKEFAVSQGHSYLEFSEKLSASLDKHTQLINDFANENRKLKENRQRIQIDSYLAMSNSFASWNVKGGLSPDEFRNYIELLGPEFESTMLSLYGGSYESVFHRLDNDKSGSLNIPEVRVVVEKVVKELKDD